MTVKDASTVRPAPYGPPPPPPPELPPSLDTEFRQANKPDEVLARLYGASWNDVKDSPKVITLRQQWYVSPATLSVPAVADAIASKRLDKADNGARPAAPNAAPSSPMTAALEAKPAAHKGYTAEVHTKNSNAMFGHADVDHAQTMMLQQYLVLCNPKYPVGSGKTAFVADGKNGAFTLASAQKAAKDRGVALADLLAYFVKKGPVLSDKA